MRKADVIAFFKTQKAIAEALGISEAAVSRWKEHVPRSSAFQIEVVTNGALKADPGFYSSRARAVNHG